MISGPRNKNSDYELELEALRALKNSFYESMFWVSEQKKVNENRIRHGFPVFVYLFWDMIQLLSLYYTKELPIKDWDTYFPLWKVIAYSRIDYLSFSIGVQYFLLITCAGICLCSASFLMYLMYEYASKKEVSHSFVGPCFALAVSLISKPLFIPTVCIAFTYIKYPVPTEKYLPEYDIESSIDGTWTFALAVLITMLHPVLILIYQTFVFEIRHYMTNQIPTAKASPYCENVRIATKYLQVLGLFTIMPLSLTFYYLVAAGLNLVECANYVYYLPYYRKSMNYAHAAVPLLGFWFSTSFLLGLSFDNATMIMLFIAVISPFFGVLAYKVVDSRYQRVMKKPNFSSPWECEVYLREAFKTETNIFETCVEILKNHELEDYKMLQVWLCYNLYGVLNDHINARLKLTPVYETHSTMYEEYQFFKCLKILEAQEKSDVFNYLKFNKNFYETVKLDQNVICVLIDIWKELLSPNPSTQKLVQFMKEIEPKLKKLKFQYKELLKTNKRSKELNTLYGTFLTELFNKPEIGKQFIASDLSQSKQQGSSANLSLFNSQNCVIIACCNQNKPCKVTYANTKAFETLGYTYKEITGINLSKLAPPRTGLFDNAMIQNTVQKTMQTEIIFEKLSLMKHKKGHLIAIQLKISFEALDGEPFLLISFRKHDFDQEVALMDNSGLILGHTERFTKELRIKEDFCKGFYIFNVVPEFYEGFRDLSEPYNIFEDVWVFAIDLEIYSEHFLLLICVEGQGNIEYFRDQFSDQVCNYEHSLSQTILDSSHPQKRQGLSVNFREEADVININPKKSLTVSSATKSQIADDTFIDRRNNKRISMMSGSSAAGSSSKGSNSSSKQENISMISMVNSSVKNVQIALLVMIFTFLCLNGVVAYFFSTTVIQSETLDNVNFMIARRTEIMQHSANLARLLDLESMGISYLQPFEKYETLLTSLIEDLETADKSIKDDSVNWEQNPKFNLYFENIIPVWESINGKYLMRKKNMFDVTSDFKKHLKNLKENLNEDLNMSNPSIYYLFRNGYGESTKFSNTSQEMYEEEWENYIALLDQYVVLTYGVTGIVCSLGILLIAWKLYQLQKCSKNIWNIVFDFPEGEIRERFGKTIERLEYLPTFDENILLEEDLKEEVKKRKRQNLKHYNSWISLALSLAVLVFVISGYFFVLYLSVKQTSYFMIMRPDYYHKTLSQFSDLLKMWEWCKETTLLGTPASIYLGLMNFSQVYSPKDMFVEAKEEARRISIFYDNYYRSEAVPIDSSVKDIVYEASPLELKELKKGLVSGIIFYRNYVEEILGLNQSESLEELRHGYKLYLGITEEIGRFKKLYISHVEDSTQSSQYQTLWLIFCLCVFSLMYLFCVWKFILNSVKAKINSAWNFSHRLGLSKTGKMKTN